jgi:hypothetical protein
MKKFLINCTVVCLSTIIAVGLLEFSSRVIFPVFPGAKYLTPESEPFFVISPNPFRFKKETSFIQHAADFTVEIHTDEYGNRVSPTSETPQIIFLGDSFTFGQGLADNETFAWRFCEETQSACANIGRSGTGTGEQVAHLKHYLEAENWRPEKIYLSMLLMSSSLMEGNDIADNLNYHARTKLLADPGNSDGFLLPTADKEMGESRKGYINILPILKNNLLARSNLARVGYFYFASFLRAALSTSPEQNRLEKGLEVTAEYLQQLRTLANQYRFEVEVVVLHPIQDLIRKTAGDTFLTIRSIIPNSFELTGTHNLFTENPQAYYYSYDGHFNAAGAERIAAHLNKNRNSAQD